MCAGQTQAKGQMRPARGLLGGLWVWLACTLPLCMRVRWWAFAGCLLSSGHADQLGPSAWKPVLSSGTATWPFVFKAWPAVHSADGLREGLDGCSARPSARRQCRASLQNVQAAGLWHPPCLVTWWQTFHQSPQRPQSPALPTGGQPSLPRLWAGCSRQGTDRSGSQACGAPTCMEWASSSPTCMCWFLSKD